MARGPGSITASSLQHVFRREAIRSVGGFDGAFPREFAELDACVALARAGWEVVHHGRAVVGWPAPADPGVAARDWRGWFRARGVFLAKHGRSARILGRWLRLNRDFARNAKGLRLRRRDLAGIAFRGLVGVAEGLLIGRAARRRAGTPRPGLGPRSSRSRPAGRRLSRSPRPPIGSRWRWSAATSAGRSTAVNMYTKLLAESMARLGHSVTVFRQDYFQNTTRAEGYEIVTVRPTPAPPGGVRRGDRGVLEAPPVRRRRGPLWRGETCAVCLLAPYPVVVRLITPVELIWKTLHRPRAGRRPCSCNTRRRPRPSGSA